LNKEIGSEFEETDRLSNNNSLTFEKNHIFTLSGKTALDLLIHDIKEKILFQTIYMPSYCCHTMIAPFLKNNIKVIFYDVFVKDDYGFEFDIDYNIPCDAVYLIQYFGYRDNKTENIAQKFKIKGKIIIEDVTHSMFGKNQYNLYTDYIFGSYRKWTSLYSGGFLAKLSGDFLINIPLYTNEEYVRLRKQAIELKKDYIKNIISSKEEFLELFRKAENYLEYNYCNYLMDNVSIEIIKNIDTKHIQEKRFKNAQIILNLLSESKIVIPIFNTLCYYDCPLFVPVVIKNTKRNDLRNFLIKNNIYCPIHWEISELHNLSAKNKYVYDNILSLVCDQRYGEEEMFYLAEKIKEFEEAEI
jgi:hypothetical protein